MRAPKYEMGQTTILTSRNELASAHSRQQLIDKQTLQFRVRGGELLHIDSRQVDLASIATKIAQTAGVNGTIPYADNRMSAAGRSGRLEHRDECLAYVSKWPFSTIRCGAASRQLSGGTADHLPMIPDRRSCPERTFSRANAAPPDSASCFSTNLNRIHIQLFTEWLAR